MNNLPILVLENIRSLYNVGSILRTASFFGVQKVFLVGYSGKIQLPNGEFEISPRLKKTALGSENDLELICFDNSEDFINYCRDNSIKIFALEQTEQSLNLFDFVGPSKSSNAFVLGNEKDGVSPEVLQVSESILEIPRFGVHNSLNVSISAAVLLTSLLKN